MRCSWCALKTSFWRPTRAAPHARCRLRAQRAVVAATRTALVTLTLLQDCNGQKRAPALRSRPLLRLSCACAGQPAADSCHACQPAVAAAAACRRLQQQRCRRAHAARANGWRRAARAAAAGSRWRARGWPLRAALQPGAAPPRGAVRRRLRGAPAAHATHEIGGGWRCGVRRCCCCRCRRSCRRRQLRRAAALSLLSLPPCGRRCAPACLIAERRLG
jgi:hypothetical protein